MPQYWIKAPKILLCRIGHFRFSAAVVYSFSRYSSSFIVYVIAQTFVESIHNNARVQRVRAHAHRKNRYKNSLNERQLHRTSSNINPLCGVSGQGRAMCTSSVATIVICLVAAVCATELTWEFAHDGAALCNDFTRAGFFHREPNSTTADQKWVVFLESGSLCYSSETCNRRYFQPHVRRRYGKDSSANNAAFDTTSAWEGTETQPKTRVVNPLMTSPYCFKNESLFFQNRNGFTIEGRDVLSRNCKENPFCNHGHVLVPYCSSDLWLGSDDRQDKQCDCWDQNCFRYNPTSEDLQFTFRGQTIFRSVLQTLDRLYGLKTASEIVLVGSSAGGVGVLNSAKWARDTFQNVSLKVIADSSWFIDFRGSINHEFGAMTESGQLQSNKTFDSIYEACTDTRLGFPCCLSAQCILTEKNVVTGEPYYPRDVPLFLLQSLYDLLLLTRSLSLFNPVVSTDLYTTTSIGLQSLMTIGEYGGEMNNSLTATATANLFPHLRLSYFATQCFQHVYLATSTLREDGGLLGSEVIELSSDITTVRLVYI